jgi:hypothetical protein
VTERGAVSVLAAALTAITLLLGLVGAEVYRLVVAKAMAQAAADAAALAAAPVTFLPFGSELDPGGEAETFAKSNGARLVDCLCPVDPVWRPRVVTVTVAVAVDSFLGIPEVLASAAAEFDPTVWLEP